MNFTHGINTVSIKYENFRIFRHYAVYAQHPYSLKSNLQHNLANLLCSVLEHEGNEYWDRWCLTQQAICNG